MTCPHCQGTGTFTNPKAEALAEAVRVMRTALDDIAWKSEEPEIRKLAAIAVDTCSQIQEESK